VTARAVGNAAGYLEALLAIEFRSLKVVRLLASASTALTRRGPSPACAWERGLRCISPRLADAPRHHSVALGMMVLCRVPEGCRGVHSNVKQTPDGLDLPPESRATPSYARLRARTLVDRGRAAMADA